MFPADAIERDPVTDTFADRSQSDLHLGTMQTACVRLMGKKLLVVLTTPP
jgi:hypothetical protein